MPSTALLDWQSLRLPSLAHIDAQCATVMAATPPNPDLIDENLRAFVVLLSAHFQGFCRDLHTECTQIIVSKVRRLPLQVLFQAQFSDRRHLDHGNPNYRSITEDFGRFGFSAKAVLDATPGMAALKVDLHDLNEWRNAAAHRNTVLPPGPLTLPTIRQWRASCSSIATALNAVMYNQLRARLRRGPWAPP